MTWEGSVADGQTNYGGGQGVEGIEPHSLLASSQNKPIILVREALSHDA